MEAAAVDGMTNPEASRSATTFSEGAGDLLEERKSRMLDRHAAAEQRRLKLLAEKNVKAQAAADRRAAAKARQAAAAAAVASASTADLSAAFGAGGECGVGTGSAAPAATMEEEMRAYQRDDHCLAGFQKNVSQQQFDTAQLIVPGLYLGNMIPPTSVDDLNKLRVSHVLTVGEGLHSVAGTEAAPHIKRLQIMVHDLPETDLVSHFGMAFAFIDAALRSADVVVGSEHGDVASVANDGDSGEVLGSAGALVHCAAGVSRSATMVIGYIMSREHRSYKDALSIVKKGRPMINPNSGFRAQLRHFEHFLDKCHSHDGNLTKSDKNGGLTYDVSSSPTSKSGQPGVCKLCQNAVKDAGRTWRAGESYGHDKS